MILRDAITKYEKHTRVTKSVGTFDYLKGKTGIIRKYLGDMECENINEDILLDFIIAQRNRNDEISDKTLNKYIGVIKQVLKYACNININFDKIPETKKIIETIPQETIDKVFGYFKCDLSNTILQRNYLIFRLLFDTGLRISELLNLKVSNIDFANMTIHVQKTKTRVERFVFFSKETLLLFNKYIASSNLSNYIFIDFVTGERLKLDTVHSICRRLRKKLGIEKSIRPHMWRHTFATRFIKKNGNMEVLRLIMGHSSLKTTQKYLHIDKDHLHSEYFRINS